MIELSLLPIIVDDSKYNLAIWFFYNCRLEDTSKQFLLL